MLLQLVTFHKLPLFWTGVGSSKLGGLIFVGGRGAISSCWARSRLLSSKRSRSTGLCSGTCGISFAASSLFVQMPGVFFA